MSSKMGEFLSRHYPIGPKQGLSPARRQSAKPLTYGHKKSPGAGALGLVKL